MRPLSENQPIPTEPINIFICVPFPFTARDKQRYGIDYLISQGCRVFIFDFTRVNNPFIKDEIAVIPDEIQEDYIHKIASPRGVERALEQVNGKKIVVTGQMYTFRTFEYLELFQRSRVPVFLLNIGGCHPADPLFTSDSSLYFDRGLIKFLKKIYLKGIQFFRNPAKGIKFVSRIISGKNKIVPSKIFVNCRQQYKDYTALFGDITRNFIPTHTGDYDVYLKVKAEKVPPQNTCVFLDEDVTLNHEEQVRGKSASRLSLDKYYSALNRLFDCIERKTGMKVIIAASPRSNYRNKLERFGGRPALKYQTAELVAGSSFVLLHGSTSFNFAVLFKKPALFITTDELMDRRRSIAYPQGRAVADAVGQDVINIDRQENFEHIPFDRLAFNTDLYEQYFKDYISLNERDQRSIWEIMYDVIEKADLPAQLHN